MTTEIQSTSLISQAEQSVLIESNILMQMSAALGGVILLIVLGTWLAKKLGITPAKLNKHSPLKVKNYCSLGNKERVVIVEINHNKLVLGVTTQSINLLYQYPISKENETEPLTFQSVLNNQKNISNNTASSLPTNK
ncbi:flagellar biosynthetic protein FliO [Providencia sneebia]|uniref:Flagellar protein n=1 Tax=Providencia sneebia DSM 19967 TaxID=1141660 RepID=K8WQY9_9GAMM|nr:flagellar biosynthetic protein FliO [Providencia sneebia]EKT58570.1 protein mopB [Providencia sneebia DSM 19967]